jgi:transcriptional regulator with XRE-family HTH domain
VDEKGLIAICSDDIFLDMELSGDVIRETRERHGLSQRRLALRAGTTQAVVSRIERGIASPTLETLRRLLAAMGWELDVGLRRSRWQDHDPEALRAFGAQDPPTRLAGIDRTIGDVAALHGAARRARRLP